MNNKLVYWIPVMGVFVSLAQFDKENDLGVVWPYYQAVMILAIIWIMLLWRSERLLVSNRPTDCQEGFLFQKFPENSNLVPLPCGLSVPVE